MMAAWSLSTEQVRSLAEMTVNAVARAQHQLAVLDATRGQRAAVNRAAADELMRILTEDLGCPSDEAHDWSMTVMAAANRHADDVILLNTEPVGSA